DRVLYYDCTNFFFEIEQEDNLRKYGASKEHRPNPIVEMGLLMDGDGIPLAYCLHSGSTNEQITLQPLEKKILK
ncbi:transposase, partial [Megasphaera sp. WILCCON 0056]